jgi:hypothetical protein
MYEVEKMNDAKLDYEVKKMAAACCGGDVAAKCKTNEKYFLALCTEYNRRQLQSFKSKNIERFQIVT